MEDPYPAGKYPDQKVWVWVPFSSLIKITTIHEGPSNVTSRPESFEFVMRLAMSADLRAPKEHYKCTNVPIAAEKFDPLDLK